MADQHRSVRVPDYHSAEFRQLWLRVIEGAATAEESVAYALAELGEADDCLSPNAPKNGRAIDAWHASACIERAMAALRTMRERQAS